MRTKKKTRNKRTYYRVNKNKKTNNKRTNRKRINRKRTNRKITNRKRTNKRINNKRKTNKSIKKKTIRKLFGGMFGSKVSEGGVNFYSICKELFDTLFDGLKSTIEKYFEQIKELVKNTFMSFIKDVSSAEGIDKTPIFKLSYDFASKDDLTTFFDKSLFNILTDDEGIENIMNELLDNKKKYGNNTTERVINKWGKNYSLQMNLNFQEGIEISKICKNIIKKIKKVLNRYGDTPVINIKNENILNANLNKCKKGTKNQYSLCCYILSLFCKSEPKFEYSVEADGKIKSLFNKAIQIDNLIEIILNLMNIDEEKYYTKGSISPVILKKVYSILGDIDHELHQIPKDDKTTATNLMMINKAGLFDKKEESVDTVAAWKGGAAPINGDLQILQILLMKISGNLAQLKEESHPKITENLYEEVNEYLEKNPTTDIIIKNILKKIERCLYYFKTKDYLRLTGSISELENMFYDKKSNINLTVLESDIKGIIESLKLIRDKLQNFSRETVDKIKVTEEQQKYLNSLDNFLNNIIPHLTSDENYSRIINIFSWENIYLSYISTEPKGDVTEERIRSIKKYLELTTNIPEYLSELKENNNKYKIDESYYETAGKRAVLNEYLNLKDFKLVNSSIVSKVEEIIKASKPSDITNTNTVTLTRKSILENVLEKLKKKKKTVYIQFLIKIIKDLNQDLNQEVSILMNNFKYTLIYAIIPLYIGDDLTKVTKENVYSILKVFDGIFSDISGDNQLDFFKSIEIKKFYEELLNYWKVCCSYLDDRTDLKSKLEDASTKNIILGGSARSDDDNSIFESINSNPQIITNIDNIMLNSSLRVLLKFLNFSLKESEVADEDEEEDEDDGDDEDVEDDEAHPIPIHSKLVNKYIIPYTSIIDYITSERLMNELATFIDTYSNQYKFVKKHYGRTKGNIIIKTLTSLKKVIDELNKLKEGEEPLLNKICDFYKTIEEKYTGLDGTIDYINNLISGEKFDGGDIRFKHETLNIQGGPLENLLLKANLYNNGVLSKFSDTYDSKFDFSDLEKLTKGFKEEYIILIKKIINDVINVLDSDGIDSDEITRIKVIIVNIQEGLENIRILLNKYIIANRGTDADNYLLITYSILVNMLIKLMDIVNENILSEGQSYEHPPLYENFYEQFYYLIKRYQHVLVNFKTIEDEMKIFKYNIESSYPLFKIIYNYLYFYKIESEQQGSISAEDKEGVKSAIEILEENEQKLKDNSKSLGWRQRSEINILKNKYIDLIYKLKYIYLSLELGDDQSETIESLHNSLNELINEQFLEKYMIFLLQKYKLNRLDILIDNYNKFMKKKLIRGDTKRKLNSLIAEANNNEYIKGRLKLINSNYIDLNNELLETDIDKTIIEKGNNLLIEIVDIIE